MGLKKCVDMDLQSAAYMTISISNVVNKCSGMLIGLMHARHVLPRDILPVIVDSLVLSYVRYCYVR